jgi:hypothetical protein
MGLSHPASTGSVRDKLRPYDVFWHPHFISQNVISRERHRNMGIEKEEIGHTKRFGILDAIGNTPIVELANLKRWQELCE